MLCHELSRLALDEPTNGSNQDLPFYPYSFRPDALAHGSHMIQPNTRPECELGLEVLDVIHRGKDASIIHMLAGGNGFPLDIHLSTAFNIGCTQERRDLRSILVWAKDLNQCAVDRKNGRVEG